MPLEWAVLVKKLSLASYYVLTVMLFSRLFADDLKRVGWRPLFAFAQWSCVPLLLVAPLLSFASFLPYLWVTTAVSIAILVFFLARMGKINLPFMHWQDKYQTAVEATK